LTNDLGLHRKFRGDKIGVHRNTVATHAAARLQNSYPRMFVGKTNKLPNVNPSFVTNQRKLIGKGNLNITASILSQLAHFSSTGIGAMQLTFHKLLIKLTGFLGRSLINPADHSVIVYQLIHHVTGQHTLRAVGNVQLILELRALSVDEVTHPLGGAYGRSRLDNVKVIFLEQRQDAFSGRLDIRNIGLMAAGFEGSGYNDQIRIRRYWGYICTQKAQ